MHKLLFFTVIITVYDLYFQLVVHYHGRYINVYASNQNTMQAEESKCTLRESREHWV